VTDAGPSAALPDDVDSRLWFEMEGCAGRHFLMDGSPHIRGRLYAYCPVKRTETRISKTDVTALSDEAAYFVRGFLSGSEPLPPTDEEGLLVEDQALIRQWKAAIRAWRETGKWTGD
jgi:hypothetical protein